mmetsp:Transcript_7736/g.11482  ORF Transcript_7736/g.11482 Transcript_7736/m.11482 type:complete len:249 (+) Transcript_7736:1218-1964(+)
MRDTLRYKNKDYVPLHASLFDPNQIKDYLKKEFVEAIERWKEQKKVDEGKQEIRKKLIAQILKPVFFGVYRIELFTETFCKHLIEECINFENTCEVKLRPNSMNKNGLVCDEMGQDQFWDAFVENYFRPLGSLLSEGENELDDHHTFIVAYNAEKENMDKKLDLHVDDADMTINFCLGTKGFEGGQVYFRGHADVPESIKTEFNVYEHEIGKGILHDGLHRHGAMPLTKGQRYNLIIWGRCLSIRKQK